tara:strand:+ start:11 stop:640 length:630 start_codon:yes stop_codon:yes gene_type:complete
MYKAILWDNDGVLVDTERWYYEATKRVMKEEGYSLTLDVYRKTFLKSNSGAWHLLKDCNKEYIRKLRKRRNLIYSSLLQTKDIYIQGLSEILSKLNNKYKMGIVTSSRREHFDIIHKRSNILKYFDFVITSNDFSYSKPSPEPYLIGINSTGYKASSCLAIEDSERGVISAKKADLFCFALPNDMTAAGDFRKADVILDNLNDIFLHLN